MKKRIYIRVTPIQTENLTEMQDEILKKISVVKNVEKIESQVGYTGKQRTKKVY